MNEIVNMDSMTAPLTAEETTLLYTLTAGKTQKLMESLFAAFTEKVEEMRREFGDKVNQITVSVAQIKNSQTEYEKMINETSSVLNEIKSQSDKIAKATSENRIPQTDLDADRWIAEMYSKINTIARRRRTVSGIIIGQVYSTMCSKYGVDITAEYSKFRKVRGNASKLIMCSVNPTLRTRFEQALLTVAEDKSDGLPGSVLVRTMPREVREICQSISPKSPAYTFQKIYKEMRRRSKVNLDEYIKREGDLQIPYKKVAKSFYVYQSKFLRPLFDEVVRDMKK